MNNTYVCPHCHKEQKDASMNTDGYYLDRDNCASDYSCPSCYGPLNGDHLDQLDDDRLRLFQVDVTYHAGEYSYLETLLFRGTHVQLEQELRQWLEEQADNDQVVCWNFEDQVATAEDACLSSSPREIGVSAREISGLHDLPIRDLS